jgi:hypothetical protein
MIGIIAEQGHIAIIKKTIPLRDDGREQACPTSNSHSIRTEHTSSGIINPSSTGRVQNDFKPALVLSVEHDHRIVGNYLPSAVVPSVIF